MKAGGAQFGSTSFTFLVRRILAPVAFGAQLCATGAVTADAGGHAQMTRPSEQMREQMIARTMRSPPPPPGPHRSGAPWRARRDSNPRPPDSKSDVRLCRHKHLERH